MDYFHEFLEASFVVVASRFIATAVDRGTTRNYG
jgi:hypothetical protein